MLTYEDDFHLNFVTAQEKIRNSGFTYITGTDMGQMIKFTKIGKILGKKFLFLVNHYSIKMITV